LAFAWAVEISSEPTIRRRFWRRVRAAEAGTAKPGSLDVLVIKRTFMPICWAVVAAEA